MSEWTPANQSWSMSCGTPTGGLANITFSTDYSKFASTQNGLVNPNYTPRLSFGFDQPLLRFFGVEVNQLLDSHPGAPALHWEDAVFLLRDADSGRIHGFSTLMRMTACVDGKEIVAFFSGDTIIDRDYWGETVLSRLWSQTVFAEAERIVAERPAATAYWFLICSGYKTWRFLPVFFREFYPNADGPTPPHLQRILDTLGARKFGDQYLPEAGIVRLRAVAPLRPGIATVTAERLRDPQVAFFARMNPGHVRGDELACLTELSRANLTRAGQRMVSNPL